MLLSYKHTLEHYGDTPFFNNFTKKVSQHQLKSIFVGEKYPNGQILIRKKKNLVDQKLIKNLHIFNFEVYYKNFNKKPKMKKMF